MIPSFPGEIRSVADLVQPVVFRDTNFSVLRLDRLTAWATGNKYFKLKPHLQLAIDQHIGQVISKGGMFSNHLDAMVQACAHVGLDAVCLVRSYEPDIHNPTIQRLLRSGAAVHFLTPDRYAAYDADEASRDFPQGLFIPEGGLSAGGLQGSAELGSLINELGKDHVMLMGGTMCTALGMATAMDGGKQIHIVPSWKGCTEAYIAALCRDYSIVLTADIQLWPEYHFGGFGKWDHLLLEFMTAFTTTTGIPLDPVYTGKLVYAFFDLVNRKQLDPAQALLVHTGGLQGVEGYAYRWPEAWSSYAELLRDQGREQH